MEKLEECKESFDIKSFEKEAILGLQSGKPLLGSEGILKRLIKHLIEASLEGEMDYHLSEQKMAGIENKRNGRGRTKRVRTQLGEVEIETSRDRRGDYSPVTVGKYEREVGDGFEAQIMELYSMGNSVEDISLHLSRMYGVRMSSGAISAVTNRVWEEVQKWQTRPLESVYVLLYLDAVHYKVREEGQVMTKAVYTIYGVDVEGNRDILSYNVGATESARQWVLYAEDLKRRGVEDVFFISVDGLTGLVEGLQRVFPNAVVQRCIVHMIRTSLIGVSDKDRQQVVQDLRAVYRAATEQEALLALEFFCNKWDKKYSFIGKKWRENWLELTAFLGYGAGLRKMIYTTNAVENVHRQMRKVTKTKGAWCTDRALIKQLYMSLMRRKKSWSSRVGNWSQIEKELIELYGERYTKYRK
ncbi:MAG: IS256 family transposase [Sphingobacteriales bacterium]|nr:MAG: IS256 family transposase [Sphingobacteriales bacterium]